MSDRKPTPLVLPAVVALSVFLGLYVSAYYATLKPSVIWQGEFDQADENLIRHATVIAREPAYYVGGTRLMSAEWFFYPLSWLDKRIRPDFWHPEYLRVDE